MNSLRVALLWLAAIVGAAACSGQPSQDIAARAARAFDWEEYNSAAAMYELVIARTPADPQPYVRAIVARQMLSQDSAAVDLAQRAMNHGVALSDILSSVRALDYRLRVPELYPAYLGALQESMPWMGRNIDNELLAYYDSRNDGVMVEYYSRRMLAGLPDDVAYLRLLARGLLLQERYAESADVLRRLLEVAPGDPGASILLSGIERAMD